MPQKSGDPNSSYSFNDMNISAHLPEDHKPSMIFMVGLPQSLELKQFDFEWINIKTKRN